MAPSYEERLQLLNQRAQEKAARKDGGEAKSNRTSLETSQRHFRSLGSGKQKADEHYAHQAGGQDNLEKGESKHFSSKKRKKRSMSAPEANEGRGNEGETEDESTPRKDSKIGRHGIPQGQAVEGTGGEQGHYRDGTLPVHSAPETRAEISAKSKSSQNFEAPGASGNYACPSPLEEGGEDLNGEHGHAEDPTMYAATYENAGGKKRDSRGKSGGRERGGDRNKRQYKKPPAALAWMRNAVTIPAKDEEAVDDVDHLRPELQNELKRQGAPTLFSVQQALWKETCGGLWCPSDICLCAPTGCGKTLAYTLPVLNDLADRRLCLLRGLVVVPTVDLASQVHSVMETLARAVRLRVACVAGSGKPLSLEANDLVERSEDGVRSAVDALVATPGRLVGHLEQTEGFSLEHLQWLVIDEADRLLRQSYQEWLQVIAGAIESHHPPVFQDDGCAFPFPKPASRTYRDLRRSVGESDPRPRVKKLVLSATLTRDPAKVNRLGLVRPIYMTACPESESKYLVPSELEEYRVVVEGEEKPLALLALLAYEKPEKSLIFASSVEAAHRVYHLLASCPDSPAPPVRLTGSLSKRERAESLRRFKDGRAACMVASDAATRGMDVPDVTMVVSYDVPSYPKTYVHRVGRTARAGRKGRAFTVLRPTDVRHFKDMLAKADHPGSVREYRLSEQAHLAPMRPKCNEALRVVSSLLGDEQQQRLQGGNARLQTASERLAAEQAAANWSRRVEAA